MLYLVVKFNTKTIKLLAKVWVTYNSKIKKMPKNSETYVKNKKLLLEKTN